MAFRPISAGWDQSRRKWRPSTRVSVVITVREFGGGMVEDRRIVTIPGARGVGDNSGNDCLFTTSASVGLGFFTMRVTNIILAVFNITYCWGTLGPVFPQITLISMHDANEGINKVPIIIALVLAILLVVGVIVGARVVAERAHQTPVAIARWMLLRQIRRNAGISSRPCPQR